MSVVETPPPVTRDDVERAAERLGARIRRTPLLEVERTQAGARVALKLECLQVSGSFKIRGAFNRIAVDDGAHDRLAAASGGNHGAAVAWACRAVGRPADVFVPSSAPPEKVRRIEAAGAVVHVIDGPFTNAAATCAAFAEREGALLVHPFDDPQVIAGQGTLGREILEQLPETTKIVVSVGGGGLAAGIAAAVSGRGEVVPVEPELCPTLARALEAGRPVDVPVGGVAGDSLGAPMIGERALALLAGGRAPLLVPEDAIVAAQRALWDAYRLAVEPAAACAWAALESGSLPLCADDVVVVVACGGNIDLSTTAWVA